LLFLLYPAVRPWEDESAVEGATRAMSSGAWVVSHLFAMVGFVLVALGVLAVWAAVSRTPSEPLAGAAVVATWVGAGLTLPYSSGAVEGTVNKVKIVKGSIFCMHYLNYSFPHCRIKISHNL
jgi:uncharacterized membrane protein